MLSEEVNYMVVISIDLFCDWQTSEGSCPNIFEGGTNATIRQLRRKARRAGWLQLFVDSEKFNPYVHGGKFSPKLIDVCAECAQRDMPVFLAAKQRGQGLDKEEEESR